MATNRYVAALRKWNWEGIEADALANVEDDPENEGCKVGRSYLGSVLALTPSGKYYQPWASANLDPCPRCHGTGHTRNPVTCGWCGGSGRRSVAELAEKRSESVEATMRFLEETSTKVDEATMTFPCFVCEQGMVPVECSWCGGIGSREAHLDQEWYEALNQVAEEHGLAIESGEGDPCDLFAAISVEAEETLPPAGLGRLPSEPWRGATERRTR